MTPITDKTLWLLLRVNRGAREAHYMGCSLEDVLYYAWRWPNGLGIGR